MTHAYTYHATSHACSKLNIEHGLIRNGSYVRGVVRGARGRFCSGAGLESQKIIAKIGFAPRSLPLRNPGSSEARATSDTTARLYGPGN